LQVPPTHELTAGQTRVHEPQCVRSVAVSMQTPPHGDSGGVHAHAPATQVAPEGQTCPHRPQFCGSLDVLTHAPPQRNAGGAHDVRH
jgi:hypothetical protein